MPRPVDKVLGFEAVRIADDDRPRGYLTRCPGCGRQIIVSHRIRQYCVDCQAEKCLPGRSTFNRFYRSGQWRQTRARVFKVKGRLCVYCGRLAACVDHQQPISRGGTNAMTNLEPICTRCNVRKQGKTHEEFLATRHGVGNA